jgi:serine phosphatase RsbU (regulator of sigma subunit)
MQVVISAGELLATPRPLAELFEAILDQVQAAFAPQRCLLLLREEEKGELVVKASWPRDQDTGRLVFSRTLVNQVLSDRSSLLTADAQNDPRFAAQESVIMQGLRSAMAAPLFDSEKVIGLLYADIADLGRFYTRSELQAFTLLANLVAVKITQARLEQAERERAHMAHEIEAAQDIMQRLLPESPPAVAGYDVCAWLQSCLEVGGDLYDVREAADNRVLLMLGDVAGKGLGAALLVANLAPAVQLLTEESSDPLLIVQRLNRRLFACTDTVRFATLFLGLLDPPTGELAYVNAAHLPPLVIAGDGSVRELPPAGLPVGAFEDGKHQAGRVMLARGDLLAIFSDGIPEAMDSDEEFYGMARLRDLLVRERDGSAGEIIETVRDDLTAFLAGQQLSDDVTLLVLRREA